MNRLFMFWRTILLSFFFAFSILAPSFARAVVITIDPGNVSGNNFYTEDRINKIGVSQIDFEPGYHIVYPMIPFYLAKLGFTVDANGFVTPENPAQATGGQGILTFKTVPINISLPDYTSLWGIGRIRNVDKPFDTLNFVPSARYLLLIGGHNGNPFYIDENGNVSVLDPVQGYGEGNHMIWHTSEFVLDLADYCLECGRVTIGGISTISTNTQPDPSGNYRMILVRGVIYLMMFGNSRFLTFSIDAAGNVISRAPDSYDVEGNRLIAKTKPLTVDTGEYDGLWGLHGFDMTQTGNQTIMIVPGLRYQVNPGGCARWVVGAFYMEMDGDGNITSENEISAHVDENNTLVFHNETIHIEALTDPPNWEVLSATERHVRVPSMDVVIVPGVHQVIRNNNFWADPNHQFYFYVNSPCNIEAPHYSNLNPLRQGDEFVISCGSINQPPILDPIGNQEVSEGQLLEFAITAEDPDDDNLTFSVNNLPSGATFDSDTATFSWTPEFNQAGNYPDIEFTVTDDGEPPESDTEFITITIGNVNQPPVFNAIAPIEVEEYYSVNFAVYAVDPDGDSVSYTAESLPDGARFDSTTGYFYWIPDFLQAGVYPIKFVAIDDGEPSESSEITVIITVGNTTSPIDLVNYIIEQINGMGLRKPVVNSYMAHLGKIERFIEKSKIKPAINQVEAFIMKVQKDMGQDFIDQENGIRLIDLATELLGLLI